MQVPKYLVLVWRKGSDLKKSDLELPNSIPSSSACREGRHHHRPPPPNTDTMFKPRFRIPRVRIAQPQPLIQRRSLHQVPVPEFSSARGIPGLLSRDGFHLAYTDYMQLLVDKLNALVAGKIDGSL